MKNIIFLRVLNDRVLAAGLHVHTVNYSQDETCQGGDPECALWQMQLGEAMEVWA